MEEVAAVRGAALDAVGDVEPRRLRERIRGRLEDGSMAPGVLTVLSARAVRDGAEGAPDQGAGASLDAGPGSAMAERGAGVQLIYEGLRLTRTLAQDPPWERPGVGDDPPRSGDATGEDVPGGDPPEENLPDDDAGVTDGGDVSLPGGEAATDPGASPAASGANAADLADANLADADMAILVADVMVARGFYLLARTEAAENAVRTVQRFGRDQTLRRTAGDPSLDRNLEADVFELAVVAGTTAVGVDAPASLREYVTGLAREDGAPAADGAPATDDALSVAEGIFSEATVDALAGHLPDEPADGVATSADP